MLATRLPWHEDGGAVPDGRHPAIECVELAAQLDTRERVELADDLLHSVAANDEDEESDVDADGALQDWESDVDADSALSIQTGSASSRSAWTMSSKAAPSSSRGATRKRRSRK